MIVPSKFFMKTALVRIFIFSFLVIQAAQSMPAQIVLIRHGEKPETGDELSTQGWARAQALPELFKRPEFNQFGNPAALYAMNKKGKNGSIRAIQTLKYVSQVFNLALNTDYTKDQVADLVKDIKKNDEYDGKMIVICWEHKVLIDIAMEFGVKEPVSWPAEQFDRAWILDFSPTGQLQNFRDLPQKLLPFDSKI